MNGKLLQNRYIENKKVRDLEAAATGFKVKAMLNIIKAEAKPVGGHREKSKKGRWCNAVTSCVDNTEQILQNPKTKMRGISELQQRLWVAAAMPDIIKVEVKHEGMPQNKKAKREWKIATSCGTEVEQNRICRIDATETKAKGFS